MPFFAPNQAIQVEFPGKGVVYVASVEKQGWMVYLLRSMLV
jgi:hypothetical protein